MPMCPHEDRFTGGSKVSKGERIQVVLVSGFLGSGKTTLLKKLVHRLPEGVTPLVLMNEFGETSVDGMLIQSQAEPVRVVEINRGSIFCACAKGDFLRALDQIAREMAPSILIVEASGIADTTDMERDLANPRIAGGYELVTHLCLVDAEYFLDWLDTFVAVERQIHAAQVLGITKCDLVDSAKRKALYDVLRELNPDANIVDVSWGELTWSDLLPPDRLEKLTHCPTKRALMSEKEMDEMIESMLSDPSAHLAPADRFLCQTFRLKGQTDTFTTFLKSLPGDVIRAKGFFRDTSGQQHHFDLRGRNVSTSPSTVDSKDDLVVFIRTKLESEEIPSLLAQAGLDALYLDE